jgi:hypothetical protein
MKVQQNLAKPGMTGQLKEGMPFWEYISCHNNVVTVWGADLRTNYGCVSLHLMCPRRRKMMMENVNLQQHCCEHWRALTLWEHILWSLMSVIMWWLSTLVLRMSVQDLLESEEAVTFLNEHVEELDYILNAMHWTRLHFWYNTMLVHLISIAM